MKPASVPDYSSQGPPLLTTRVYRSNTRWRTNVKFGNFQSHNNQYINKTMATSGNHTRRKTGIKLIQRGKGKSLTSHMQQQEDNEKS